MAYKSLYTGSEVDEAVSRVLGDTYDSDVNPGCKQIGLTQDLRQDLNQVTIPGIYTVFFYYNGPDEIEAYDASPIRMRVYWEGSKEIQWILYHTDVYYRDIQTTTEWTKVELAAKEVEIIDNLISDRVDASLSANMGRYIKQYIDGRIIGGPNLITNSSFNYPYNNKLAWLWSDSVSIDSDVISSQFRANLHGVTLNSTDDTNPGVYITTDPAFMPSTSEASDVYTASLYISKASDFMSIDKSVGKKYIDVTLQVSLINNSGDTYLEQSTASVYRIYEDTVDDNGKLTVPVRLTNTYNHSNGTAAKLYMSIGIITTGSVTIYAPKLELGNYATAWTQSYNDQYYEFINAKRFHDVEIEGPTDANPLKQQTGYRYDTSKKQFVLDQLAVGGGGGFVVGTSSPSESQCLWFKSNDYDGYLYYYNTSTKKWTRIPIIPFNYTDNTPSDTEKFWLDKSTEDNVVTASLKYYDTTRKIWRLPVTAPTKCYTIQATEPENNALIWIHSDTHIPRVYDDTTGEWVIMHAAWGENRT